MSSKIKMNLELGFGMQEHVILYGEDIQEIKFIPYTDSSEKELSELFRNELKELKNLNLINSVQYRTVKGMINRDNDSVINFIYHRKKLHYNKVRFKNQVDAIKNKYNVVQPEGTYEMKLKEPTDSIKIELYKKGIRRNE